MPTRKIQVIAGTSYSITLPKEWIIKNNLKEQNEVFINEKDDGSLAIHSKEKAESSNKDAHISIDKYKKFIDQVIFILYYRGFENITLFSDNLIPKDVKSTIRKQLMHMSGTEITHEDEKKITIKILLDKSKVRIPQVMYRVSLIIDDSISNIQGKVDQDLADMNENEVDRLYHLIAKIITISIKDSQVLESSGIKRVSLVPYYFLISKRLENIADHLKKISDSVKPNNIDVKKSKSVFDFISRELLRSTNYILGDRLRQFDKPSSEEIDKTNKFIGQMSDVNLKYSLDNIVRHVIDIEEQVLNISLYTLFDKDELF